MSCHGKILRLILNTVFHVLTNEIIGCTSESLALGCTIILFLIMLNGFVTTVFTREMVLSYPFQPKRPFGMMPP